jgi:Tat protein secretion system quality control protein TatD with DNase activity
LLLGLYYASISISHDAAFLQSVKGTVSNASSGLLRSAGLAETQQQIEREVLKIAKSQSDNLFKQTGVHPSLDEEDLKNYLREVYQKCIEVQRDESMMIIIIIIIMLRM